MFMVQVQILGVRTQGQLVMLFLLTLLSQFIVPQINILEDILNGQQMIPRPILCLIVTPLRY